MSSNIDDNIKKSKEYLKYNKIKDHSIVKYNDSFYIARLFKLYIRLTNYNGKEEVSFGRYDEIEKIDRFRYELKEGTEIYLNDKFYKLVDKMISRNSPNYPKFMETKGQKLKISRVETFQQKY